MKIPRVSVGPACLLPILLLLPTEAGGQLASEVMYAGQPAYAYQSLVYGFTSDGLAVIGWQGTEPEGDPSVQQIIPTELLIPPPPPVSSPPQEYAVTSIGVGAFSLCMDLPSVVIPATVTNIGDGAFQDCITLYSVYFLGNAPICSSSAFTNDLTAGWGAVFDPATAYYLPGATGWSNTFAGLPTALMPQVLTANASFGVQTNQFGFTISWASGMTVAVDASTSLVNPTWVPLATNTLTSSSFYFSDPQWTNYPARFYRLRQP